jgi:hypothetical protein
VLSLRELFDRASPKIAIEPADLSSHRPERSPFASRNDILTTAAAVLIGHFHTKELSE